MRTVSGFILQNMYIPRAQALSETFSQNPRTPLISSAFYSFPENEFCSKAAHSEYQTQRKTKLVIGISLSTTAQTYSLVLFLFPLAIFPQKQPQLPLLLLPHCPHIFSSSAPVGFSCKLPFPLPVLPFLLTDLVIIPCRPP